MAGYKLEIPRILRISPGRTIYGLVGTKLVVSESKGALHVEEIGGQTGQEFGRAFYAKGYYPRRFVEEVYLAGRKR